MSANPIFEYPRGFGPGDAMSSYMTSEESRAAKATPTRSAKTTKIGLVRRMVARCRQAFAQ